MKLNFKKLEIHSFMSFDDEIFDFGARRGMTLVRGKNNDLPNNETNAAGKSTVFAALTYVLFGEVPSKVRKNENIVNRYSADRDMRLVLTFDVDDSSYKAVRGLNKGKNSYFELYLGETNITKSSIAETQDFMEKEIIRCDLSIFLRTILLTSKQTYNFYDLKKSEKKEFVEKLFDISVFGDMYQAMHRDVLDCDKLMLSHQNKLLVLSKSGEDYRERMSRYDVSRAEKIRDIDGSISSAVSVYENLKSLNIKSNTAEAEKLESALFKINEAKRSLNASMLELESKNSKIELAIHKLGVSKDAKQSAIDKHSEIMDRLCDECRPIFAEYYGISGFEKDISDIAEKITKLDKS